MKTFSQKPDCIPATPVVSSISKVPPGVFTDRPEGLNHWQLILTTQGHGRIHHAGGTLFTHPGELLLFPPHIRQFYGNSDERKMWIHLWCIFQPAPHWQRWLHWPEIAPGLAVMKADEMLPAISTAMQRCQKVSLLRSNPSSLDLAMCHLEEVLIHCHMARHAADQPPRDARVTQVVEKMAMNLHAPALSLTEIAAAAGLSVSQVSRLFEKDLGAPPAKYQENLRIQRASELLSVTTMRISEIATEVGFEDPLYFSRRFCRVTGMSPKTYRKVQAR